jgi:hypothetical protein
LGLCKDLAWEDLAWEDLTWADLAWAWEDLAWEGIGASGAQSGDVGDLGLFCWEGVGASGRNRETWETWETWALVGRGSVIIPNAEAAVLWGLAVPVTEIFLSLLCRGHCGCPTPCFAYPLHKLEVQPSKEMVRSNVKEPVLSESQRCH